MNESKQFSVHALYRALIKSIAKEGKNELERFLMQQNVIQYQLGSLIKMRSGIMDERFIDWWIENATLGTLIKAYKICANSNKTEQELMVRLKAYNNKRNKLTHRLMNVEYQKEMARAKVSNFGANATNALGMKIINNLERLIGEELEKVRKLLEQAKQKAGKTIEK